MLNWAFAKWVSEVDCHESALVLNPCDFSVSEFHHELEVVQGVEVI